MPKRTTFWFACLLAVAGCGGAMKDVKKRAASDFNCPESQIQVNETGKGRFAAQGCGQKADCSEMSGNIQCTKEAPAAPAPPPGAPPAQ